MASQRPSTSKSQAHLNTGASRSKLAKELKELLDLAKNIEDEPVFQQEHRYKKFKAKNHIIEIHKLNLHIWGRFFEELLQLKFHKECIYWCTKILEDVRLCDSSERSSAIYIIVASFHGLDDFENVFRYGEKYLAIGMQTMTSEERVMRRSVLFLIQEASRKLNRIEEYQYPKEILKLDVERYNAKEMDKLELLSSYWNCINMQIEIGNFKSAKKTLKHLKLFSLNSMHSNDAIKAIENEDYKKVFPSNNLLNNSEVREQKKIETDFCKRNSSDHESFQLYREKVEGYMRISRICWQKHILMNLGEIPFNFDWGHLALNIHHDISLHLELLVTHLELCKKPSEEIEDGVAKLNGCTMIEIVAFTLLLADKDLMNRKKLFSQLTKKMYDVGNINCKWTKCIMYAQRQFSNLDVQIVVPFLEFCLRFLNEGAASQENNELKMQLSTFKNSLRISNHFAALKNTLAFQPIQHPTISFETLDLCL